ncbi:MAG: tRNA adenosine(34) deaminase TadA [Victivallales bacterium]|nr:tRNA adenosine(34) deaminase TadA [Victivallales bacterium]
MTESQQAIDEHWMRRALELARDAARRGEVPVGAVVVSADGDEVSAAGNAVETLKDATAHAEVLALRAAAQAIGDWRLDACTLYVTKEPCAMCAGAAVNCRVGALVFGVSDPRMGAAGGAMSITDFPGMLHRVPVRQGVCANECRTVLQEFFRSRRNTPGI